MTHLSRSFGGVSLSSVLMAPALLLLPGCIISSASAHPHQDRWSMQSADGRYGGTRYVDHGNRHASTAPRAPGRRTPGRAAPPPRTPPAAPAPAARPPARGVGRPVGQASRTPATPGAKRPSTPKRPPRGTVKPRNPRQPNKPNQPTTPSSGNQACVSALHAAQAGRCEEARRWLTQCTGRQRPAFERNVAKRCR